MKAVAVLAKYFNSDPDTKKSLRDFAAEVKELSDADKMELATLAAAAMGVELERDNA